ncbi:MAG TPA: glycosyltransferase [Anaeromyxobacteraceae bacterium]|nr:glycosyltransferase [Anaeromyxobacteraceae bacterium]
MNIVLATGGLLPALLYGGTERVVWCLAKALGRMGHRVSLLAAEGSRCDFAEVIPLRPGASIDRSIPGDTEVVHLHFVPAEPIGKPSLVTVHFNQPGAGPLPRNAVFVSRQQAERHGSTCFVHNGLDWSEYGAVDLDREREYFHFLGKAAWRVKNVRGAIQLASRCRRELKVLGGHRLNFKMGFRLTLTRWATFHGMVDDRRKRDILSGSRGLVFPVRWHEPFGLALIESLYFGCPVFGTPYGSLPEIVSAEVGFLSASSDELVPAMQAAGRYSPRRCHEYARDRFDAMRMAHDYLKMYQSVASGEPLNGTHPALKATPGEKFLPWR